VQDIKDDGAAGRWVRLGFTLLPTLGSALYFAATATKIVGFDEVTAVIIAATGLTSVIAAYLHHRDFMARQAAWRRLEDAFQKACADRNEAQAKHAHLQSAFDVLPEPLIVFDDDDRVVMWNKRYAEHSSLAPVYGDGSLRPGMTFTEVMRANLAKKRFPAAIGREEEWLAERLANHTRATAFEQQISDEQWVRFKQCRLPEGGLVSVRTDITELKRREASFRLLFDENPMPMCVFDHGTLQFLAVNQAFIDHYGYDREQLLTMSIHDITPAEEIEAAKAAISTLDRNISHTGRMWRHIKADGHEILIAAYSREIEYEGRRARLTAIIDVTERTHAEQELRSTRAFLEQIIDNVPLSITVKDTKQSRFVMMNRTSEQLWGVSREEAIGKTVADLFGEERAREVGARDRAALEADGPVYVGEHRKVGRGDQDRIFSSRRVALRDAQGRPTYVLGVMEDVTERKRAEQRIEHLARFDELTELPNRAAFTMRLADAIQTSEKSGNSFALLFLDLDRFKEVNDVFGHSVGDALLREIANRLKQAAEGAFVARLGGDEFTVIVDGPADASAVAQRILSLISDDIQIGEHQLRVGVSVGIALFPDNAQDASTLLANADAALYRAKGQARGSVRFFEAEMDMQLRERRALQQDLQKASSAGELSLHYQPQARMNGEITGFEALVRWHHPARGLIPPAIFIPLAEESSAIIALSKWVLYEACREAASWKNPLRIAVNLSPMQFRSGELPELVHLALLESGLPAHRLELEVTEGALIDDFSRALSTLRRLKSLGVRIAMDDFGTGYSSLSYLQSFPFDKIKIDRSFIAKVESNAQSAAIVRGVIGLARGLHLPVLAEGVENDNQLSFLSYELCDEAQGYLIGHPKPIDQYADMVRRPADPYPRHGNAGRSRRKNR
jgi:diguanylate cyclase (GGDEF)-like protein/PAS domain S-box-containing protein